MNGRFIMLWLASFSLIAMAVMLVFGSAGPGQKEQALPSQTEYPFSQNELKKLRALAEIGAQWKGRCLPIDTDKEAAYASTFDAAARSGNVVALLCRSLEFLRAQDPLNNAFAYQDVTLALMIAPDLPPYIERVKTRIAGLLSQSPKTWESLSRRHYAKLIAAGLAGRKKVIAHTIPAEERFMKLLDGYEKKRTYWQHKCPNKEEYASFPKPYANSIYNIIEEAAYQNDIEAMLCAARNPIRDETPALQESAYFWYVLASLTAPKKAPQIKKEMQALAVTMDATSVQAARNRAERWYAGVGGKA